MGVQVEWVTDEACSLSSVMLCNPHTINHSYMKGTTVKHIHRIGAYLFIVAISLLVISCSYIPGGGR